MDHILCTGGKDIVEGGKEAFA